MNRKLRVASLPASAPAAMVDVKDEDVVVEHVVGNGVELSSAAKEVHRMLKGL